MSTADTLKTDAELIRQRTVSILEELSTKNTQFGLATFPKELEGCRKRFAENTYNVLVVGEAKRGKSSFVNALIGRDLLPTDVDIATNQVFRVMQAEKDSFALRFDNGSTLPISAAELLEYGSQAVRDSRGPSRVNLDHLNWIEVNVPIDFLPAGVSLLDTPGLGSLYAAHAQITQRFVPLADAVIFVLDSSGPMGEFELQFLENILEVTRHVFFIQTKIDLYDKGHWQQIQQRHQTILAERFGDRLVDTHVWPISNRNLLKATEMREQGGNPAGFLKLSRQPELSDALELFLFKVAGVNRCNDALLLADYYYMTSRKMLASRVTALDGKSTQELVNQQQQVAQLLQQFEMDWGPRGKKRWELTSGVQKIAATSRQSMVSLIGSGGELESSQLEKIRAVQLIDEVNKLSQTISEEIVRVTATRWRELCEQARLQYATLLGTLIEATDALQFAPEDPNLPAHVGPPVTVKDDLIDKFSTVLEAFDRAGGVALAALYIASFFVPITWGIAIIGIAIAGIFGVARSWKMSQEEQLAQARNKLEEYLSTVMHEVHKRFLEPDVAYNGMSLVNYHFDSLINTMNDQIEAIVAEKSEDTRKESARLEEQINMDKQQRAARKEELQQQLTEWDQLGRSLRATNSQLADLEQKLAASSTIASV